MIPNNDVNLLDDGQFKIIFSRTELTPKCRKMVVDNYGNLVVVSYPYFTEWGSGWRSGWSCDSNKGDK